MPRPTRTLSGRGTTAMLLDWWPQDLPAGTRATTTPLITFDGAVTKGVLYERDARLTVVALMHPRQDVLRARQVPGLVEAGFAVWSQNSRDVGNDLQLSHESTLLDVAAGMEHLRELGFANVVLLGISGGAALYTYYTEQSLLAPDARVVREPSGRPTPLADAPMPSPDALALVAPHPGQGRLLMGMIDPSVIDEADRFSRDPELDPYAAHNGFSPAGSRYEPAFVERYRAAQEARVARIDERAREAVADALQARGAWKERQELEDLCRSVSLPILVTYRTDADLRTTDLRLDPSDRRYGSIMHPRPQVGNYGVTGFGRLTTPHAWLSTWSGHSALAATERAAAGVTVPALVVEYTGDQSVFPSDVARLLQALGSDDVEHHRVRADHFGRPLADGDPDGTALAVEHVTRWARARCGGG
jgi:hypothetical protein